MPRTVAVVGDSGSGKTLLAAQLTAVLVRRGLRVAYVKHAPHGFEPGREGSDSERLVAVGATPAAVVGPGGLVHLSTGGRDATLEVLLAGLGGDLVLLEGFGDGPWPKLRVALPGVAPRAVADPVVLDLVRDGPAFTEMQVGEAADLVITIGVRSSPSASDPPPAVLPERRV